MRKVKLPNPRIVGDKPHKIRLNQRLDFVRRRVAQFSNGSDNFLDRARHAGLVVLP